MYADYSYYRSSYHGTLSEEEYTPLAERAGAYIDSVTDFVFQKIGLPAHDSSLYDRLKKCSCALADEFYSISGGKGTVKTSETVGSYSVSYASGAVKSSDERLYGILELYLSDVVKAVKWI